LAFSKYVGTSARVTAILITCITRVYTQS
jgi:hypothetical protein